MKRIFIAILVLAFVILSIFSLAIYLKHRFVENSKNQYNYISVFENDRQIRFKLTDLNAALYVSMLHINQPSITLRQLFAAAHFLPWKNLNVEGVTFCPHPSQEGILLHIYFKDPNSLSQNNQIKAIADMSKGIVVLPGNLEQKKREILTVEILEAMLIETGEYFSKVCNWCQRETINLGAELWKKIIELQSYISAGEINQLTIESPESLIVIIQETGDLLYTTKNKTLRIDFTDGVNLSEHFEPLLSNVFYDNCLDKAGNIAVSYPIFYINDSPIYVYGKTNSPEEKEILTALLTDLQKINEPIQYNIIKKRLEK